MEGEKEPYAERVFGPPHSGIGRPGAGPQAARHVRRDDRPGRAAPVGVRGRRQQHRRGGGRLCRRHRGEPGAGQRGDGARRRARHPGGRAPHGEGQRAAGGDDHAARGGQVQQPQLRGLRGPARGRRLGGQRAGRVVLGGGAQGGADLPPVLPPRGAGRPGGGDRRHRRERHRDLVPGGCRHLRDHRILVRRADQPAARAGVPQQGESASPCATAAGRSRASTCSSSPAASRNSFST